MFRKKSAQHRRRKSGAFGIARIFLSLIMISILGLGVYGAYKSFSGVDPLKISPTSLVRGVLRSDNAVELISGLLSFNPKQILEKKSPVLDQNQKPSMQSSAPQENSTPTPPKETKPQPKLDFRFAVVADSHNDNEDLGKALTQAKEANAEFVIGLGDFTDVGTADELRATKIVFDSAKLPYHVIPGDHDLWDSRNRGLDAMTDFKSVFGPNYSSFNYHTDSFLLIDNSDNYLGIPSEEWNWIVDQLTSFRQNNSRLVFAFASTPLYHPSSDHFMGKVEPKLKSQAQDLIYLLKTHNTDHVFAGDTHFFSDYTEPKNDLKMTAVGAITRDRNIQNPRYCLVDVYQDGSYNIVDTEVK